MTVIVDGFGGDNAPLEIVKGCAMAVNEYDINIKLVGKKDKLILCFKENNISQENIEIIDAPDIVYMDDDPKTVLKKKPNSSMVKGLRMLSDNEGDCFVSAGNSGALVVGATLIVKRIKGIKRAAFAPVMPKKDGVFMLIDSGANVNCQPLLLKQFGIMGHIYMKSVMHIDNPRVGLANVGIEEHKGTQLQLDAYKLLKETSNINFVGNVEARDIPDNIADVVVADGFTGNIFLKTYEGVAAVLLNKIKGIFKKNLKTKLAALLILKDMKALKKSVDYNEYGGAPVLGVRAPVFKAHGSSNAITFKNSIRLSVEYVNTSVIDRIEETLKNESKKRLLYNEGHRGSFTG